MRSASEEEVHEQQAEYASLLGRLGTASHQEIEQALGDREPTEPEPGLTPELMERMRRRLAR